MHSYVSPTGGRPDRLDKRVKSDDFAEMNRVKHEVAIALKEPELNRQLMLSLKDSIGEIGYEPRVQNSLEFNNIFTIEDLLRTTSEQMLEFRNCSCQFVIKVFTGLRNYIQTKDALEKRSAGSAG